MTTRVYDSFKTGIASWAPAGNSIGALLVDDTVVFNATHGFVSQLTPGCIIAELVSNNATQSITGATVTTIGSRKIFDLPDITFKVLDTNRSAAAVILYHFSGGAKHLMYFTDRTANSALPFDVYPTDVTVAWSNSANKVFSWPLPASPSVVFEVPQPAIALAQQYAYTDVVVPVTRPTTNITKAFERQLSGANAIFKDINNMGKAHPITGDLTRVFDNEAIKKSIENILMTDPMEIPFSPKFGVGIQRYLFEINDVITANSIRDSIRRNLQEYEPRITVKNIDFVRDVDQYALGITIEYYINSLTGSQQFTLFLKRR